MAKLPSGWLFIPRAINKGATIEVEQKELVTCKDCKYWDTTWQNDFAPNYHYCPLVDGTRRDDFYCADAERRCDQDERHD